ncbi:MAG: OmpA family protein [Alphaproteobacteria bacterium]
MFSRCNSLRLVFALLLLGGGGVAAAENLSRRPSAAEIVERLRIAPQTKTRSVLPNRGVTVENNPSPVPASAGIDLEVNFKTGSARLTPDAEIVLDNLGRALMSPELVSNRFLVAGHTDAAGSDAFNQTLSEKRAAAVRDYLVQQHHVAFGRLMTIGHGRSRLADPEHPVSEINRRVQVTNLGTGN